MKDNKNITCKILPIFNDFKNNFTYFIDIGALIFGVLIALCNVAGIGGGGINVSVCIILLGLTTKQSLAISSFCIFTGAFVRFILNFNEKHPFREAKSIDYTIVMMMMFPTFLLGTMIGTKISISIPDVLLLSFTTIVLTLLSIHTTITAIKLRRKEIDAHGAGKF